MTDVISDYKFKRLTVQASNVKTVSCPHCLSAIVVDSDFIKKCGTELVCSECKNKFITVKKVSVTLAAHKI